MTASQNAGQSGCVYLTSRGSTPAHILLASQISKDTSQAREAEGHEGEGDCVEKG